MCPGYTFSIIDSTPFGALTDLTFQSTRHTKLLGVPTTVGHCLELTVQSMKVMKPMLYYKECTVVDGLSQSVDLGLFSGWAWLSGNLMIIPHVLFSKICIF